MLVVLLSANDWLVVGLYGLECSPIGHSISQGWYWSCPQGVSRNWDFPRKMGLFGANSGIVTWAMKSSPSMNKFVDMIQAQIYVYIFYIYWCSDPHWHGGQLHIYLYIDIYMIHNMTYIFLEIRFRHRLETCLCQPFLWNIDLPEDDTGSSFRSQGDAILTQFEAYLDTHQALDEDIHFLLFFENHLKHNGCHTCGGGRRVVLRWWLCRAWQLLDHVAGGICAPWHIITALPWYKKLGGGFIFKNIFTPIWGRFPFWRLFFKWGGLKPPTN